MAKKGRIPNNKLPTNLPNVSEGSKVHESMESAEWQAKERRYKAESALGDIERAEKHKSDKSLMKDVKKVAKEKMKCLGKIC